MSASPTRGGASLDVSRRRFLAGSGALVIGAALPLGGARAAAGNAAAASAGMTAPFTPNAFVRIDEDSTVTVLIKHIEFGQGPFTGLATLVAEELDADWAQIRAEHAPARLPDYANMAFGVQGTGGSTAMAVSFDLMRKAGAAARAMLVEAAAQAWDVDAGEITVAKGVISHAPSGRQGRFGDFTRVAATLDAPAEPTLKSPEQFVYIGHDMPKLDTQAKSTGTAQFTLDVYRPGMLTVVVARAPRFGATVTGFDDTEARKVKGVVDVQQISTGVAVYATDTWAALQGRKALQVHWDDAAAEKRSSAQMEQQWLEKARGGHGITAGRHGDVAAGLAAATQVVEAEYVFPYLAHAPMEPLDGVIERRSDGAIEVWMGSQIQTADQGTIAAITGVAPAKVHVNTMFAGGSFGRRAQPAAQFAGELAQAFVARGGATPVKLMWTREDDIQGGFYRPLTVHRVRAGLDADGRIVAWDHVIANQSIMIGTPFEKVAVVDGLDVTSVEGARELPYSLDNVHVSVHNMESAVPVLWWRSVGHTHTGYAVETFVDELLEKAGRDAVQGRLEMMAERSPRLYGVLERAATMADWGREAEEGHAFGVAVVESFSSYVAQIVDVSMGEDGMPVVHKVWCAVDCGLAVTPNVVRAQMEGGIGFGLGHVLHSAVDLDEGGTVRQTNFDTYPSLRLREMPTVEVAVMRSDAPPTGVGEPGVPPIGPAVANAVRRLTGRPLRRLPFRRELKA